MKPTREQLDSWADDATCSCVAFNEHDGLEAFLRSTELLAAMELAEAVAWIEKNGVLVNTVCGEDHIAWSAIAFDLKSGAETGEGYGDTLPEAVRALRVKMGES